MLKQMKKMLSSATRIVLLTLVFGLVYMSIAQIEINETFKTALLMVLSFYFGQKTNQMISDAKILTVENKDTPQGL